MNDAEVRNDVPNRSMLARTARAAVATVVQRIDPRNPFDQLRGDRRIAAAVFGQSVRNDQQHPVARRATTPVHTGARPRNLELQLDASCGLSNQGGAPILPGKRAVGGYAFANTYHFYNQARHPGPLTQIAVTNKYSVLLSAASP